MHPALIELVVDAAMHELGGQLATCWAFDLTLEEYFAWMDAAYGHTG